MAIKDVSTNYLLDRYIQSMTEGLLRTSEGEVGHVVWPAPLFTPLEADMYVSKTFFPRLKHALSVLRKRGYSERQIAKLFIAPSRLVRITYLFHTIHVSSLTKKQRLSLCGDLLRFLYFLRFDLFCENGKNLRWNNREIQHSLSRSRIIQLSKIRDARARAEMKTIISKLISILYLFCELIYFCHHQIGHETHGPYIMDQDEKLLVRDYYDLKPDTWPFTQSFNHGEIRFLTIYKTIDIEFDYANRSFSTQSLADRLTRFGIMDSPRENSSLKQFLLDLLNESQRIVEEGCKRIATMSKMELMQKYGEMFFYAIKPLQSAIGEDWHPPESFYKDLQKQEMGRLIRPVISRLKELPSLSSDERIRFLKQWLDPRNH